MSAVKRKPVELVQALGVVYLEEVPVNLNGLHCLMMIWRRIGQSSQERLDHSTKDIVKRLATTAESRSR